MAGDESFKKLVEKYYVNEYYDEDGFNEYYDEDFIKEDAEENAFNRARQETINLNRKKETRQKEYNYDEKVGNKIIDFASAKNRINNKNS